MKKILGIFLFLLALFRCTVFADISFDVDGKWETSFNVPDITQLEDEWEDSTGLPDGIIKWSSGIFTTKVLSDSAAPVNNWMVSLGNVNEWYYKENLTANSVNALNGPDNLTIGGVVQEKLNTQNGVIGSLSAGERGWGDEDTIGFDTTYIYSLTDPDGLDGKSIAWILKNGRENYVEGDSYSSIITAANNPDGEGGGYRAIIGDGSTTNTGLLAVVFPSQEKEIWIRWYMRWEDGFAWLNMNVDKSIYLYSGFGGDHWSWPFEARSYNGYYLLAQGYPVSRPMNTDPYGFEDINGGIIGNYTYHCFELQLKMDTDQTDGVGRIWIDGILRAEVTDADWSAGYQVRKDGIKQFSFEHNQAWAQNSRPVYVDYDDMAVYNKTPPGDCDGIPCIGPIVQATPAGSMVSASINGGGIE